MPLVNFNNKCWTGVGGVCVKGIIVKLDEVKYIQVAVEEENQFSGLPEREIQPVRRPLMQLSILLCIA